MGDSDEEYERRKARDKFRRERNDYDRRDDRRGGREPWEHDRYVRRTYSRRSGGRNREVWTNRNRDRRDSYGRDYDSRRRDRFSPQRHEISPPSKRMRHDWDDGGYQPYDMPYGGGGGPMHSSGPPPGWVPGPEMGNMPPQQPQGPYGPGGASSVDYPTQPPMMTFKQFLSQQDDSISEQDAIKRYNEYKVEFRRQQISEFFLAHKEEEWFKSKYHPEECGKRQDEVCAALQNRMAVFRDLMTSGRMEGISVDVDLSEALVKLLDAAVIKMEGGNEFDLTILDIPEEKEEPSRSRNNSESVTQEKSPEEKKKKKNEEKEEQKTPEGPLEMTITPEQEELAQKAKDFMEQQKHQETDNRDSGEEKKGKKRKRKREYSYESGSDSDSGSDSEPEPGPPGVEDEPLPPGLEPGECGPSPDERSMDKPSQEYSKEAETRHDKEKDVDTKMEEGEDDDKPRALHKTCSIFLRNLAPTITKQEVEAVCKRYPGFIRVALQDPQPERRFFRRGWVTFSRSVNIKDICWSLNNIRLRDCELGATLNRELKQRVRPVNGITAHRNVVKQDIKVAAKIIQNLDEKWHLWEDPDEEKKDEEKSYSQQCQYRIVSRNPILKNITDYLVEEGSFEEEELLGESMDDKPKDANPEVAIERDQNLLKVLDKMILYLRIVYSIDYYSANEYPNEDEMPHRCGIMHARGSPPSSKITQNDVNDWISNFEGKVKPFVEMSDQLEEEEALKLGKKDPEAEVEKFVQSNTQELAKDKWLCPLSGKKFKGPEFIRKHIFNKHSEKIEEVKKEVSFFNNYLLDPKRPQLPEHPGNKQHGDNRGQFGGFQGPPQQGMMGYNQPRPLMMFGGNGPQGPYSSNYPNREPFRGDFRRPNYSRPYRDSSRFSSRSGQHSSSTTSGFRRNDPRSIIEYRDLDAPEDGDIL